MSGYWFYFHEIDVRGGGWNKLPDFRYSFEVQLKRLPHVALSRMLEYPVAPSLSHLAPLTQFQLLDEIADSVRECR